MPVGFIASELQTRPRSPGRRRCRCPRGFVTLLMTDIEGSTALVQSARASASAICSTRSGRSQRRAVSEGWRPRGRGPRRRVLRRVRIAPRVADRCGHGHPARVPVGLLDDVEVRLRIGIHSGYPTSTASNYIGLDVNITSRICGVGHGGQIVVTANTTRRGTGDEHPRRHLPRPRPPVTARCRRTGRLLPGRRQGPGRASSPRSGSRDRGDGFVVRPRGIGRLRHPAGEDDDGHRGHGRHRPTFGAVTPSTSARRGARVPQLARRRGLRPDAACLAFEAVVPADALAVLAVVVTAPWRWSSSRRADFFADVMVPLAPDLAASRRRDTCAGRAGRLGHPFGCRGCGGPDRLGALCAAMDDPVGDVAGFLLCITVAMRFLNR